MATPKKPAKPTPGDQPLAEPELTEPVSVGQDAPPDRVPTATSEPTPLTPEAPARTEPAGQSDQDSGGGKVKAAALLAGATALANKVRQEAPKKVKEIREKRVAGRCVLLTNLADREVAIGPYPDEQAARMDLVNFAGVPRVVELVSQASYHGIGHPGAAR